MYFHGEFLLRGHYIHDWKKSFLPHFVIVTFVSRSALGTKVDTMGFNPLGSQFES
jgi:hypothetical protein